MYAVGITIDGDETMVHVPGHSCLATFATTVSLVLDMLERAMWAYMYAETRGMCWN